MGSIRKKFQILEGLEIPWVWGPQSPNHLEKVVMYETKFDFPEWQGSRRENPSMVKGGGGGGRERGLGGHSLFLSYHLKLQ